MPTSKPEPVSVHHTFLGPADTPVPVHVALARIMGELPAIGKDDRMTGSVSYNYRGIETITAHLQPLLSKHGVIIVPQTTITSIAPALDAKPGWQDTIISIEWLIVGPDGSTLTARTVGVGRDNSDKGANKAESQAFKYLLLHLFCIADKNDDADGIENRSFDESVDPEPRVDPIMQLAEAVKAAKGTPLADELKTLADFNQRKLTPKAFSEDPEWALLVTETITDYHAREIPDTPTEGTTDV